MKVNENQDLSHSEVVESGEAPTVKLNAALSLQAERLIGDLEYGCAADFTKYRGAALAIARAYLRVQHAKWQPIESAPKDGTWILVCTSDGKVAEGHWHDDLREFPERHEDADECERTHCGRNHERRLLTWSVNGVIANPPKWWMPLPAPPITQATASASALSQDVPDHSPASDPKSGSPPDDAGAGVVLHEPAPDCQPECVFPESSAVPPRSSVSAELLPCPFCACAAEWAEDGEQKLTYGNDQAYCPNCFASAAPDLGKEAAAQWWNTRAPVAERDALVEALELIESQSHKDAPKVATPIPGCYGCIAHSALATATEQDKNSGR